MFALQVWLCTTCVCMGPCSHYQANVKDADMEKVLLSYDIINKLLVKWGWSHNSYLIMDQNMTKYEYNFFQLLTERVSLQISSTRHVEPDKSYRVMNPGKHYKPWLVNSMNCSFVNPFTPYGSLRQHEIYHQLRRMLSGRWHDILDLRPSLIGFCSHLTQLQGSVGAAYFENTTQ